MKDIGDNDNMNRLNNEWARLLQDKDTSLHDLRRQRIACATVRQDVEHLFKSSPSLQVLTVHRGWSAPELTPPAIESRVSSTRVYSLCKPETASDSPLIWQYGVLSRISSSSSFSSTAVSDAPCWHRISSSSTTTISVSDAPSRTLSEGSHTGDAEESLTLMKRAISVRG
jgi:hypothetical protein